MAGNTNKIGLETEKFLPRVTPSSYSQVMGLQMALVGLTPEQAALIDEPLDERLVTGTRGAVLPLTFTLSDKNNVKISFVLLINPENMNHGKTNSIQAAMSRNGFVTQLWGPNQDLITATGKTAAFYASGIGLTDISSQRSFGYKNFMALFSTYRNNGYELLDQTKLADLTGIINIVHGIEMDYDGQTFLGHFNNFTIDDAAESPFVFNYNFEFVVSSLSTNYNEIRGHFIPPGEQIERKPKLVAKIGKSVLNTGKNFDTPPEEVVSQGEQYTLNNRYASDTLIEKYPDRISQLLGPVLAYMKKGGPYTGTDQNLYLQVFYPVYRNVDPNKEFPINVQNANPGIKTPADYVRYVNNVNTSGIKLNTAEYGALQSVAKNIGVSTDSLFKLIALESGWDPQAKNPRSSARGLIQFMDRTAREAGFSASPVSSNAPPLAEESSTSATR